jgi:hypothetical protein
VETLNMVGMGVLLTFLMFALTHLLLRKPHPR